MAQVPPAFVLRRCLAGALRRVEIRLLRSSAAAGVISSSDLVGTTRTVLRSRDHATSVGVGRAMLATAADRGRSFSGSASLQQQASQRDAESAARSAHGTAGDGAEESEAKEEVFGDPRVAILDAALDHVETYGFSESALAAGAKERGFHSVATGMFPKGGADLIYHAREKALQEVKKLNAEASKGGAGGEGTPDSGGAAADEGDVESESGIEMDKLRQGIRTAVSSIARFKTRWAHAMGIGALPQNMGTTSLALAVLADELAFLGGDRSTDLVWYGKRGYIAGIYASTELHMLTDDSDGLADTWAYLDRRLSDYESLMASPQNVGDIVTGAGTVATSFSSAAVSLAGPFLRQASKQVPGGETLAQTAPNVAALAAQAFSLMASQLPHAPSAVGNTSDPNSSREEPNVSSGDASTASHPPTYPGAPERDPWSEKLGSGRAGKSGKFEDELAREERELFGGKKIDGGGSGNKGGVSSK
ncbi:unnamed protein product [Ascophyllum nodosum]